MKQKTGLDKIEGLGSIYQNLDVYAEIHVADITPALVEEWFTVLPKLVEHVTKNS